MGSWSSNVRISSHKIEIVLATFHDEWRHCLDCLTWQASTSVIACSVKRHIKVTLTSSTHQRVPPACITPNVDGKVSKSKLKKLCPPTFGPYQRELSPRHISQKHASKTSNLACMNSYAMLSCYSLDACFWGPAFTSGDSLYARTSETWHFFPDSAHPVWEWAFSF